MNNRVFYFTRLLLLTLPLLGLTSLIGAYPRPLPNGRSISPQEALAAFVFLPFSGGAADAVREVAEAGELNKPMAEALESADVSKNINLSDQWILSHGGSTAFCKKKLLEIKNDVEAWNTMPGLLLDRAEIDAKSNEDQLWLGYIDATKIHMNRDDMGRASAYIAWVAHPFVCAAPKKQAMTFLQSHWAQWLAGIQ